MNRGGAPASVLRACKKFPCGYGRDDMQVHTAKTRICISTFIVLLVATVHTAEVYGGCLCITDVDNSGSMQIQDPLAVIDCVSGNCAGCVNSCDINCDGTVDLVDFGVAWCAFQGVLDCCNEPTGACTIQDSTVLPECFVTLQGACEFWSNQMGATGGQYLGDGTTLAACGIPTVSEWGLVILTLVLMISGSVIITRFRFLSHD